MNLGDIEQFDVNSLSSDEWDHIARDIIYGRTDSERAKALDADYIRAGIMPEFNSNWDLIMARIEPKEKRDFKQELNAWGEKYSYKGKEKGDEKMTNDTLYQISAKYKRMKDHERDRVEMDNRISEMTQQAKEAVEEQQRYNTFVLRELFEKLVKNIKVDIDNKTVIVWWIDGVKTHVHCMEGDEFNPEYGIMRCVFKRAFRNGNDLKRFFKKYIPENNAKIIVEDELHSDNHTKITYENALRNVIDTHTDASEKKDDAKDYFNEEFEKRLIFASKEIDGEEKE